VRHLLVERSLALLLVELLGLAVGGVELRACERGPELRLTVREVTDALRRFGRPRSRVERDDLGLDAEPIAVVPPRRSAGPAQVIELAAARQRRSTR